MPTKAALKIGPAPEKPRRPPGAAATGLMASLPEAADTPSPTDRFEGQTRLCHCPGSSR